MNRTRKSAIIILLLIFSFFDGKSQNTSYNIIWDDDIIGVLNASRAVNNETVTFDLQSSLSFKFFFKMKIDYNLKCVYVNNQMTHSFSENMTNEDLDHSTRTNWDGLKYNVEKKDNTQSVVNSKIFFSMASLYYSEPKNLHYVYSESLGTFVTIKPVSESRYQVTLPDGKKNFYTYSNGLLTEVEVRHTFATIYFKLKQG